MSTSWEGARIRHKFGMGSGVVVKITEAAAEANARLMFSDGDD